MRTHKTIKSIAFRLRSHHYSGLIILELIIYLQKLSQADRQKITEIKQLKESHQLRMTQLAKSTRFEINQLVCSWQIEWNHIPWPTSQAHSIFWYSYKGHVTNPAVDYLLLFLFSHRKYANNRKWFISWAKSKQNIFKYIRQPLINAGSIGMCSLTE